MKFEPTELDGVYVIRLDPQSDERGYFARAFCQKEFIERGLVSSYVQSNISRNNARGTFRGLHFQLPPYAETKLMRCIQGSIYDVCVDLRRESKTYKKWFGIALSDVDHKMLYVPAGFANGYLALEDGATAFYMTSAFYTPESERGIRFDDPVFGIVLPEAVKSISDKDAKWPNYINR